MNTTEQGLFDLLDALSTDDLLGSEQTIDVITAGDPIDTRDLATLREHAHTFLHDGETTGGQELFEGDRATLEALLDEIDRIAQEVGAEFEYGETLIPEEEFEDYARELAEDIGAINAEARWPNNCIDWKQAADELALDYSTVTIGTTDYMVRS